MIDWFERYKHLIPLPVTDEKLQGHVMHMFPMVHAIKRQVISFAKEGIAPSFLEVGAGTAVVTKILNRTYDKSPIFVIDSDNRITEALRLCYPDFNVYLDDCEEMRFETPVNIIHHQGLLEHFSEAKIVDILQGQAKICQAIVFCVPIAGYPACEHPELRLTIDGWRDIINTAGLRLLEYGEFGIDINHNEAYFVCHP